MCLLCKPSLVKQTLCNLEKIEPTSDTCEYKPTPGLARLLLTAFLVHAHPTFLTTMVSESIDSQDTNEEEVRKALTSTVIAKTDTLIETLTNRNSDAFVQALFEFRTSFEAWKTADRIALLKVLVTSYVNLSSSVAQLDSVNVGSTDTLTNDSTPTPSTLRRDLCDSMRDIENKVLRLGVSKTQFHMHVAVATPLPTSDNEDEHDTAQAWDEADHFKHRDVPSLALREPDDQSADDDSEEYSEEGEYEQRLTTRQRLDGNQLDVKDERCVRRDDTAGATIPVRVLRSNGEKGSLAHAHRCDT